MNADDVVAALRVKVEALQAQLLAKVEANLSGEILQSRLGALKASVIANLSFDTDGFEAAVASAGIPYAAIQEYGGQTAPHDIVPVKARALAFAGAGGAVFARRVHHPGSRVPARAPFGSALEDFREAILGGLKDSVLESLGAS